jgi:hypothetical protein
LSDRFRRLFGDRADAGSVRERARYVIVRIPL